MMGSGRPTYTVAARPILRIVDSLDMPAVLDMRLLFGIAAHFCVYFGALCIQGVLVPAAGFKSPSMS